ncbi:MAG: peptidase M15 [Prevotellaceae bacterium]|jgi:hypothetical protein|nr:peptidase M15 [Prevotellaceae bacterium]
MKHFKIEELVKTSTGLANVPDAKSVENLKYLVENLLDPVREQWGKQIVVNSGFRSPAVNLAVRGAKNSSHLRGEAADITAGSNAENRKLFELIKNSGLVFDQLIDEQNYAWLHLSLSKTANRKQTLHLN